MLHRDIDSFTDKHPVTRSSKKHVMERYGKYSGIVIDIFYDHFLSANWDRYSDLSLKAFARERYQMLDSGFSLFPQGVKSFFPYFVRSNWLETYTNPDGLAKVLGRMSQRTSLPDHSAYAVKQLRDNYNDLRSGFFGFFSEICEYVQNEYDIRMDAGI